MVEFFFDIIHEISDIVRILNSLDISKTLAKMNAQQKKNFDITWVKISHIIFYLSITKSKTDKNINVNQGIS